MNLKRLWDTENKKIVWAVDKSDHRKVYQVWTNDDGSKLYIYKKNGWVELDQTKEDVKEYWPVWKELEDETVGYYLTNEPTDLYNWDSGEEVAYRFMNWTTVLESWKVDEGETPEYTGETPTKEATAQYTYTFSWWKPAVWPISKKTDFKAQFEATPNNYTVTFWVNDESYGSVNTDSVTVAYGTSISASSNVLTVWWAEITATAEEWYEFDTWWELPATVTWDLTITATFKVAMHTVTFSWTNYDWEDVAESQDPLYWSWSPSSVQVPHGWEVTSTDDAVLFYPHEEGISYEGKIEVSLTFIGCGEGCSILFGLDIPVWWGDWITDDNEIFYITWDAEVPLAFEIISDPEEPAE